jgi:hypothetical protein
LDRTVLAHVDDQVITAQDLEDLYVRIDPRFKRVVPEAMVRRNLLNHLIEVKILVILAKRAQADKDPAYLKVLRGGASNDIVLADFYQPYIFGRVLSVSPQEVTAEYRKSKGLAAGEPASAEAVEIKRRLWVAKHLAWLNQQKTALNVRIDESTLDAVKL